ncbi:MAG: thiamine phosphate synthase [Clostridia bacterium]|nr:thiamine phosphate synthase [Clostridia bacterium]
MKFNSSLYLVTDSSLMEETDFLQRVEAALEGGVTLLQLREKQRTTREYLTLAQKVHALARRYGVPLLIDDRVDIALAMDADGVHLGQTDLPIAMARKLLGKDKLIGATAKTVAQAQEAYEQGADYLGVGAIYPTTTKVQTTLTSIQTLKEICRELPIPVNAIGGLNKENMEVLRGCGIAGICVVSAIMKAEDPKREAELLRERIESLRKGEKQ